MQKNLGDTIVDELRARERRRNKDRKDIHDLCDAVEYYGMARDKLRLVRHKEAATLQYDNVDLCTLSANDDRFIVRRTGSEFDISLESVAATIQRLAEVCADAIEARDASQSAAA